MFTYFTKISEFYNTSFQSRAGGVGDLKLCSRWQSHKEFERFERNINSYDADVQ